MQKKDQEQLQFLIIVGSLCTMLVIVGVLFFIYPHSGQKRDNSRLFKAHPELFNSSLSLLENKIQQANTTFDEVYGSEQGITEHLSTLSGLKGHIKSLENHLEHYNKKRKSVLGALDSLFEGVKKFVEERLKQTHLIQKSHEAHVAAHMDSSLQAMQEKLNHYIADISKKENVLYERLTALEHEQKSFARKKELEEKCSTLSSEINTLMTMLNKSKSELHTKIEQLVPSTKHAALQKEVESHIVTLEKKLGHLATDFDQEKKKMFKSLTTLGDDQKHLVSKRELSHVASKEEVEKNRTSTLHAISKLEHALEQIKNEFSRNVKVTQNDLSSFAQKEDVHQTMSMAFSSLDALQKELQRTKEELRGHVSDLKKNIITKKEGGLFVSKEEAERTQALTHSSLQKMQQAIHDVEHAIELKIKEHERMLATRKETKHFATHRELEKEQEETKKEFNHLKTVIASIKDECTTMVKKYAGEHLSKHEGSSFAKKEDLKSSLATAFEAINKVQKKLHETQESLNTKLTEYEKNKITKKDLAPLATKQEISHFITKEVMEKTVHNNLAITKEDFEHRLRQSIKGVLAHQEKSTAHIPLIERDLASLKKQLGGLHDTLILKLREQQKEFASKSELTQMLSKYEAEKTHALIFSSIHSLQERLNTLKKGLDQSIEVNKENYATKKEIKNLASKDEIDRAHEHALSTISKLEKKLLQATKTLSSQINEKNNAFVSKTEFKKNNEELLATLHSLQRKLDKKTSLQKSSELPLVRENKKGEESLKTLEHKTRSSLRELQEQSTKHKKDLSTLIVSSLENKMKELKDLFSQEKNELTTRIAAHISQEQTNSLNKKIDRIFKTLDEKMASINQKNSELGEKLNWWNHQFDIKLEKEKQALTERFENRIHALDSTFQEKYQKLDDHLMSTLESKISSTEARLESQINHTFYKLQKQLQDLEYKLALTKKLNKRVEKPLISHRGREQLSQLDEAISTSNDLSSLIKNTVKKEMYISEEALKHKEVKAKKRKKKLAELLNAITDADEE